MNRNRHAKKKKKKQKAQEGSILTIAIVMTAILTLLAGGLAQISRQEAKTVYRQELSTKAFFLAEAGVAEAFSLLNEDLVNKDNSGLFPEVSLGEGSYDVTILQPNNRVVIQSIGKIKHVERKLLVEVIPDSGLSAFDYGLFTNKEGELKGNSTVNANIHSNDKWELEGNVTVNGIVTAVGEVDLSGNASASEIHEGVDVIPFPIIDFNYYYNLASTQDRYTGEQHWTNVNLQPVNGVVYVNGDVKITGNSHLTGVIVATGEIEIAGTFTQSPVSNLPALMSRDDEVELHGNVTIGEGLIYAAADEVEIKGNVTIQGSIIGFEEVKVEGNGSLNLTPSDLIPPGLIESDAGTGLRKLIYHE